MKNIYKSTMVVAASSAILSFSHLATARDHIDVVGSSTVYPFSTVVAV